MHDHINIPKWNYKTLQIKINITDSLFLNGIGGGEGGSHPFTMQKK